METRALLQVDNVWKSFSGVRALQGASLSIQAREIRGLVGENGSGKSTLIKICAGVLAPDSGSIRVAGQKFKRLEPIDAIRRGIQVIYQDFSLFPNLTVAENIALPTQLAGKRVLVSRQQVLQLAEAALQRLGVQLPLDDYVERIRVAHQQLVAIARALLQDARLIIMDEPTATLNRREVEALFRVISRLKSSGVAVLFVSHKLNEVCEVADSITVLRNGRVCAELAEVEFNPVAVAEKMTGRHLQPRIQATPSVSAGAPVLRVNKLSRRGCYADVSFQLHHREILGITGLLGSGQAELTLGLFGLLPADSGEVRIHDIRVLIESVSTALELGIALVPEDRLREGLFPGHSIGNNLVVSQLGKLATRSGIVRFTAMRTAVRNWMEALSIEAPTAQLPVDALSGGNQQRVVLGRWLATHPRVLILNNPTAGVDVGSKYEIHKLIRDLSGKGMGVILVSDDLAELLENCDRLILMREGKIVNEWYTGEITQDELSRQMLGGAA